MKSEARQLSPNPEARGPTPDAFLVCDCGPFEITADETRFLRNLERARAEIEQIAETMSAVDEVNAPDVIVWTST